MDGIERQAEKHNLDMDILIQVNISGEETKSGISKEEVEDLLKYAGKLKHVKVKGLMTIAPKTDNLLQTDYILTTCDNFLLHKAKKI